MILLHRLLEAYKIVVTVVPAYVFQPGSHNTITQ